MNLIQLLTHFTSANLMSSKEDNPISRKEAFAHFSKLSKQALIASAPAGLLALSAQKARAQSMGDPIGALQLALTLEYLEDEFYLKGLESGVIPSGGREEQVFMQISKHETAHVAFLIAGLGSNTVEKPEFDFTAGGTFDPFMESGMVDQNTAYTQFLALSQAFEDTGVRAYKGQAANLMSTPDLLTAALQIHSVEARHASEVRRLRGLKGWIVQDNRGTGMPAATQPVYDGEQLTNQAGFDTTTQFGADAGTESYDEPLTADESVAIASLFIVS